MKDGRRKNNLFTLKVLSAIPLVLALLLGQGRNEGEVFPSQVVSVVGESIELPALAEKMTIVVVAVKATWCTICLNQLSRIKDQLDEFRRCNVTFLVLSPGPRDGILKMQESTGFPYPFIEDKNLTIARSLGLQMTASEIRPAILILNPDMTIRWVQKGRNILYYGDPELMEVLDCGNWI
jgi:peroxiredoxin